MDNIITSICTFLFLKYFVFYMLFTDMFDEKNYYLRVLTQNTV